MIKKKLQEIQSKCHRDQSCAEPRIEERQRNAQEIKMLIIFVFALVSANAHNKTGWTFHFRQSTEFDSSRFNPKNTEIPN